MNMLNVNNVTRSQSTVITEKRLQCWGRW